MSCVESLCQGLDSLRRLKQSTDEKHGDAVYPIGISEMQRKFMSWRKVSIDMLEVFINSTVVVQKYSQVLQAGVFKLVITSLFIFSSPFIFIVSTLIIVRGVLL